MDAITVAKQLEEQGLRPWTYEEIRQASLNTLMKELTRVGITATDALTAKPDAIAGMLYVAQYHDPDVVVNLEQNLKRITANRANRSAVQGPAREKKVRNKSSVFGAVAQVHKICKDNPTLGRKEVIALCVKAGINENTAKTQYAKWRNGQLATKQASS